MALNLRSLIARLNTTTRGAMEGAAGLCMSRGHYEVEVEHVLLKLMEVENTDIRRILRQFEIAPEALATANRGYLVEMDRRAAIAMAVAAVGEGDTLLIAGKGHEDYQIIGTSKTAFDDRVEARAAFAARTRRVG